MESKLVLMTKSVLLAGSLAFSILVAVGCGQVPSPPSPMPSVEQPDIVLSEEAKEANELLKQKVRQQWEQVALSFLRTCPTFKFDGIPGTITLTRSEEAWGSWVFIYKFQNRQAGYGDRTGMFLAQVITDHQAEVIVEQGEVKWAIIDGQWDELRQKMLK